MVIKETYKDEMRTPLLVVSEVFFLRVLSLCVVSQFFSSIQLSMMIKGLSNDGKSKIDVNKVRVSLSTNFNFTAEGIAIQMDMLKMDESKFSRQLSPAERYNGIRNLLYVFVYPNATSEEIGSALVNVCLSEL